MLILSSLIVKEWFRSLISALIVLFFLITTGDVINGFLQGKDFLRVVLEYSLKMPDLMGKMLPICCLVASLFSLNKLKSHSELIAILAAGYSYTKIYILIGSCALSMVGLQFLNLGYIEPYANKVKRQEIQKSKKSEGRYLTRSSIEGGKFWYKSQDYFAAFDYFDRDQKKLKGIEVFWFNNQSQTNKIATADEARFENGRWIFTNVKELVNLDHVGFPQIYKIPEKVLGLKEVPEDFGEFEADLTTLNFIKLWEFIRRLSKTGINMNEFNVILLNKLALSLSCLIFALIPVSAIFNPNRRSSSFGKNVVFTLLVTICFWVSHSSLVAFGNSGRLPAFIAVFVIPGVFLIYVVRSFWKNQKLAV
ncbi:MAG: LptF/LptG family permease [Bacteriovoracaceae bacterium]|jgi:lipopolysaccharide export system permease protein